MPADAPTIRRAVPRDAATLANFNVAMARETEGKALGPATARAGADAVLKHPDRGFYLVAERDGEIAGSLLVTAEWSDWRCGFFWWIQSVYVRPERRQQGVYRALYGFTKEEAAAAPDVCGLRLYVDAGNRAAQEAYAALGMAETNYRVWEWER